MLSSRTILFVLSVLAPSFVRATNDWSVPCVDGSCSWDTGDGKTTAYSSMAIAGTNKLISDITPAAGWEIQGCDPDWASGEHTFQMTCSGSSNQTTLCSHLFEGGAENTIVRLPADCGKGPFARVASIDSQDGTSIARRKAQAEGSQYTVKLDYAFSKIPTSRGKATFAITSTNIPGLPGVSKRDLLQLRGRGRAGALHRRKFGQLQERGFFGDAVNSVGNAASSVGNAASSVGNAIGDAADSASNFVGDAADTVGNAVGDAASAVTSAAGAAATAIGNAVSDANNFDKTFNSGPLTPINFSKDVNLFDKSISCNSGDVSGSASLKVDVAGNVQGTVSFGATVVGTIVPPEINDFSVNADLGGSASATFTVDATVQGQLGTGNVELFKTGLPGLSIPSVVTIGPEFSISGAIDMNLEAEAKMVVTAGWDFPSLNLVFPESKGGSSGSATVSGTDNPLQLSADPSIDVSGTVTGHLIPRVDFGIDLFDGVAQASVFIDADTSASVTMEVKASAQIQNDAAASASASASASTPTAANDANTDTADGGNSTKTDANASDADKATQGNADDVNGGSTGNSTTTDPVDDSNPDDESEAGIQGSGQDDTIEGDSGEDTIGDSDQEDTIGDESQDDTFDTGAQDDTIEGDSGEDTLNDDSQDDTLDDGTSSADTQDDTFGDDTFSDDDGTSLNEDEGTDNGVDDFDTGNDDETGSEFDDGSATADDGSNTGSDDSTDDSGFDDSTDDSDFGDSTFDDSSADSGFDSSSLDDPTSDDSSSDDSTFDNSSSDNSTLNDASSDDPNLEDSDTTDDFDSTFVRKRAASGSVSGCVTVNGAINVKAGVTGSLEPFIKDATKSFDIFSKEVQLFQKCLGSGQAKRRALQKSKKSVRVILPRADDGSGLQCPAKLVNALSSLI